MYVHTNFLDKWKVYLAVCMYRAVISYNGAGREGGKEGAECSVGVGHGSVFSFPGFWGIGDVWSFWPHFDSTLCIGFKIIRPFITTGVHVARI